MALTLSKDGNPEVYVLNLSTGALRRLTSNAAIDTEPSWSPTGREIAFVSDRAGPAQVFVMDAEGTNVRRLTQGGFNTQPRWSPKGDIIAYTSRQGNHDLWAVSRGSNRVDSRLVRAAMKARVGAERRHPCFSRAGSSISSSRCSATDRGSNAHERAEKSRAELGHHAAVIR